MASSQVEDGKTDETYIPPVVCPPTVEKIKGIAKAFNFDLSEEELQDYSEIVSSMLDDYSKVYRMVEPRPPVKYPRLPGYRPLSEDNKLNAWYMKTDIQGNHEGKLFGKTVAVKDNVAVAGVPMMNGSKLLEGYIPEFDATVVTRTLEEGGKILGKSACENLCYSGNSFTNDIGPVLNPHDTSRSSGGSSSGSAALVASGEVDLAIGGDQGGSIRIPSSWCGIVGLKPSYGLVPYTGAANIEQSLDHLGPMARTVTDCALYLEVLAGLDGMDSRQPGTMTIPEYSKLLKSDLTGMKIGLVKEGFSKCEADVKDIIRNATNLFLETGAIVEEVSIPMHLDGKPIWIPLIADGGYETIVRKSGFGPSFKGFQSTTMKDHMENAMRTSPNSMSLVMKLLCLLGEYMRETNNYQFYCRASNLAMRLNAAYNKELETYDVLIMPTLPYKAPKLPEKNAQVKVLIDEALGMVGNVCPFDVTGHPALSINAGFSEGLPIGMMIVGKHWHEQDVLDVAYAFEVIRDHKK